MRSIIAVGSGKGGVGKSTVAANLAVAIAARTAPGRVALIDIDFYGPSIPTLMGGGEVKVDHEQKFIPPLKWGVKYISIAFFLKNPDDPVIWRGPMFGKGIQQLFQDVSWGEIDYCVVDLPPGTGDAQLSLAQGVKLDGAILVTTPQEVALLDVRRALNMFRRVNVPILGVVENMAGFITPQGERIDIFGAGGGEALAREYGVSLLGSIPLAQEIRIGGDRGQPIASDPASPLAGLYGAIAESVIEKLRAEKSAQPALKVVN